MALYETVFITRQDLTLDSVDALSDKLSDIIIRANGKIVAKEYWGLRNLAYKINKSSRGHYISLNIESGNEGIEEFRRVIGLNEDIIRSDIFRVESHSEESSKLFVSINAKDYKPSEGRRENKTDNRKAFDAEIDKIVININ